MASDLSVQAVDSILAVLRNFRIVIIAMDKRSEYLSIWLCIIVLVLTYIKYGGTILIWREEAQIKTIIDLPSSVIDRIRKAIDSGRYKSIAHFILMAAENQLVLEETSTEEFAIQSPSVISSNFDAFSINRVGYKLNNSAPNKQNEPEWTNWLWGQINRIFPIKVAVRLLGNENARLNSAVEFNAFKNSASLKARELGKYLEKVEKETDHSRDDKLSTGLPIGSTKEKSMDRYASQFIGYVKSDGSLSGALFELCLAEYITKGDIGYIQLTSQGAEFAYLRNPVLDQNLFESSLLGAEVDWFLSHISSFVPGETSLFRVVLSLICEGVNQRSDLNDKIAEYVKDSGWSPGMVSTQRSGAISRLYELNLINKSRKGLEVRYGITSKGEQFLERLT